jgi:hypothetical protein
MQEQVFLLKGVIMKTREIFKPITFVLFLLMAFSGVALADQSNSLIKELKQVDVFHPPANSAQMPLYNEWHYFNVMDEEQNLSIICTFKLSGIFGASQILLGSYSNENSKTSLGSYPISDAKYSSQTPDVKINNSTVTLTPLGYSVHAEADGGSMVFDALFKPEGEPSPEYNASGFSPVYGGNISWIVASPKMKVDGKITVNGKTYTLKNARGYHDHNWGYWDWGDIGWDWGQATQTKNKLNGNDVGKYSLNFGNITDLDATQSLMSVLNLWRNKEVVATFSGSEMQIKRSNFNNKIIPLYTGDILPAGSFPLPLNTNIFVSSNNGDYLNIEFVTEVKHSVPLPITLPVLDANGKPIMKYRLIWEMTGTYQVNGKINGKPISFTTDGFMEYVSGKAILPVSHP